MKVAGRCGVEGWGWGAAYIYPPLCFELLMRTKALLLQFRGLFPDICEVLCFWAIAGGCPDKHLATRGGPPSPLKISNRVPPPLMSLQIRSDFWKRFQVRKNDIWSGLDPQNRAPAYTGAQFSQNRRIPKNTKK